MVRTSDAAQSSAGSRGGRRRSRVVPAFALSTAARYTMRMKRTNLVLDEDLLQEATRLSGEKTYSAAVQKALRELVRRAKARQILELRGSGLWEGELAAMRAD